MQDKYWASEIEPSQLLSLLEKRIKDYQEDLRITNLISLYERAYRAYYGGRVTNSAVGTAIFDNAKLSPSGRQGEKTRLKANHFRNLVQHWIQLVTSQKFALQARASNSDYKSQAQTILANGLLDYYQKEKDLGNVVRSAVEGCFAVYGEMFVHETWNPKLGKMFSAPMGQPIHEGDIEYKLLTPLDVIRDIAKRSDVDDWLIVRQQKNKWDIIADNPGASDAILRVSRDLDLDAENRPSYSLRSGNEPINDDLISEYTFYHRKTPAMPEGRMVSFVRGAVLFDGPLPYKKIPVCRLCISPLLETIYGFTLAWDLLSIQDGIDTLHTTLMSNNKTFGIQSIWTRTGDGIQVSTLGQGMQHLKSEEMPQPIQLTKSAPEAYSYLSLLESTQERISGISSTIRGNPEANLRTGNALALVVSQSIQFANGAEAAINKFVSELGMDTIDMLKEFTPDSVTRVMSITGKANRSITKEFFPKDELDGINRVVIEQVNPLSKTIAGRIEMANNMLQQGMIKTPQDYQQVLATGQLDSSLETDRLEELAIQAENEDLREGRPVQAILTENHPLHIQHHKSVIADPEAKKDPVLVQAVLNHIQEHLNLWRQMPPDLLAVLGMQPAMPVMPGGSPETAQPGSPAEKQAQGVGMPSMPDLPKGVPQETQAAYDSFKGSL